MKIALINPPISLRERYGKNIKDIGGHQEPLGLCYLAAFLEMHGVEVKLIDAEIDKLSNREILSVIKNYLPDVIGITSTTVAFSHALSLAQDIKLFNPRIIIVLGGSHVTANPGESLAFDCFDYGVLHEGEITFWELLKVLSSGGSAEGLAGIVYRKNGSTVNGPLRPYIEDLDSLSFPARHLLKDIKKYSPPLGCYLKTPVVNMITSRGCPNECIFCDSNVFGKKVRYHSALYVVSEIEHIITFYKAREIAFVDDTFTLNRDRIKNILSLLREKNIKVKWSCMTRVDTLTKDLLKEMRDSGCWQISIGVESGNQKVLDFVKKRITLGQVRDVVNWSNELNITVKGFFMLGLPTDTQETIEETISFAKAIPLSDIVVTLATPIPGTKFFSIADTYGSLQGRNWVNFSYWKPVFIPRGLSAQFLYKKQEQLYRDFYFRIRIILKHLNRVRSIPCLIKYLSNITQIIFSTVIYRRNHNFC